MEKSTRQIKNRLAEALKERSEGIEQQTATAEILRTISSSPADAQPIFDSIAASAARLCHAEFCHVFQFDGELIHFVAHHGLSPEGLAAQSRPWPAAPDRGSATGRCILSGSVEEIPDVRADEDYKLGVIADAVSFRSIVAVPLLHNNRPVGALSLARSQPEPIPDRQIALLRTFADQAVIAIENARLFEQVQALTRELQEALEYQTATSEVLSVISRAPSQLQPVFEAIVETATRLCHADSDRVHAWRGRTLSCVRHLWPFGGNASSRPQAPDYGRPRLGQWAGGARTQEVQIHDALADPEFTRFDTQAVGQFRTLLGVPLLREGAPIGVVSLQRRRVDPSRKSTSSS